MNTSVGNRQGLRVVNPPRDPQPGTVRRKQSYRAPRARGNGPLVYVASDQASRVLFTRIAQRWVQMHLLVAQGARQGVQLAKERHPRLVVVEGRLPDADAVETVARLRRRVLPLSVPIVVLHDDDSPAARARFLWAGANAYITRPLNVARIDRTVTDLLGVEALW